MHEFSLMADLINKIVDIAEQEKASRIIKVNMWLGALSHISSEHFREHFVEAVRNSIADGATLVVEESEDINDPHAQDILIKDIELVQ